MSNDRVKFRVWNLECNEWRKNVAIDRNGDIWALFERRMMPLNKETHIVEFCTGLKDKNGKLIFEGDSVFFYKHYTSENPMELTIKYDDINCCWRGVFNEDEGHVLNRFNMSYCEIIGNIHEVKK